MEQVSLGFNNSNTLMLKSSFSKHPKTLYRHTEKSKEFSFGKRRRRFRLLSSPACTTVTPSCGSPRCRHPTSAAHPECIVLREKVWAERMRSFGPMGSMSDLLRSSLRKQVTEATVELGVVSVAVGNMQMWLETGERGSHRCRLVGL